MANGIMALDLAAQTGFAFWPGPDGGKITHGSVRIAPTGAGDPEFLGSYHSWLQDMITVLQPAAIGYEAPIFRVDGQSNAQTAFRLMSMAGITCGVGYVRGIQKIEKVHLQSAKKHLTGDGHAKKDKMVQYARIQGFDPEDHNAADAIAVLLYAKYHWFDAKRILGRTA